MRMGRMRTPPRWVNANPQPSQWIVAALVGVLVVYWLFAWSLERLDMTAWMGGYWQPVMGDTAVPSFLVFIVELFHWRVLRHLVLPIIGWFLARQAAVSLVQSLYQMPDRPTAADFLARLQSGSGTEKPIEVSGQKLLAERDSSVLLRIGGPGTVRIPETEVAVTEINGRFHRVLGPGRHLLERFEYILTLLDLRPQERQEANVPLVTKDGIEMEVDLRVNFRLETGGEEPTATRPYPYSEEAARLAVYTQIVMPDSQVALWTTLPLRLSRAQIVQIVARYRLDEILQMNQGRGEQPYLAIQDELNRQVRRALEEYGIRLNTVLISRLELPAEVTDQYVKYWQTDWETRRRMILADGTAVALEETELSRAEAEMTMIQAIVEGVQRARRDGHPAAMGEIVALRLIDALEQMARQSQRAYPLPGNLLPQLQQLRQHLLPGVPPDLGTAVGLPENRMMPDDR